MKGTLLVLLGGWLIYECIAAIHLNREEKKRVKAITEKLRNSVARNRNNLIEEDN